eukprot:2592239-Rhodomonas_salina.1
MRPARTPPTTRRTTVRDALHGVDDLVGKRHHNSMTTGAKESDSDATGLSSPIFVTTSAAWRLLFGVMPRPAEHAERVSTFAQRKAHQDTSGSRASFEPCACREPPEVVQHPPNKRANRVPLGVGEHDPPPCTLLLPTAAVAPIDQAAVR